MKENYLASFILSEEAFMDDYDHVKFVINFLR
jgi:hypothetical protein